jgi:hypothetical protein
MLKWFLLYMVASVGDAVTSWLCFQRGYVELNLSSVINFLPSPLLLPLVEAVVVAPLFYVLDVLRKHAFPLVVKICMWALCLGRFIPMINNLILLLR